MRSLALLIVVITALVAGAMLHAAARITMGPTVVDKVVEVLIKEVHNVADEPKKTQGLQPISQ